MSKVYHKNKGIPVEKRLPSGELVHTYKNLLQARRAEKKGYTSFMAAIENKQLVNGHIFCFVQPPPAKKRQKSKPKKKEPWKGENGMFDIDGWGTLATPV